jgi:hypothetical protein
LRVLFRNFATRRDSFPVIKRVYTLTDANAIALLCFKAPALPLPLRFFAPWPMRLFDGLDELRQLVQA